MNQNGTETMCGNKHKKGPANSTHSTSHVPVFNVRLHNDIKLECSGASSLMLCTIFIEISKKEDKNKDSSVQCCLNLTCMQCFQGQMEKVYNQD